MIRLYDSKCKNFENNGICSLKDTISCTVTEELNGELVLDLEYPINSKYIECIKNENIIKCDAGLEEDQLFRIVSIKPGFDTIQVYGEHISYDLNKNILEDTYPQNQNGSGCLNWIGDHTQFPHDFRFSSDIEKIASARYVRKNPIEAIIGDIDNSFVKIWGGELYRNNFLISMLSRRGSDNGYRIKYRKNLSGLDCTCDNADIVTRIMPQGYNGLLLPEKYVDSPLIDEYPFPKIRNIEFSDVKVKESPDDEEGFDTEEEAFEELRRLANEQFEKENIDKPSINMKVDFIDLSHTTKYSKYQFLERALLGDTVNVDLEKFSVSLRVIKTVYDSLSHILTSLELGEFKANYIKDSDSNMSNAIKEETQELQSNILGEAQKQASSLISKATNGYVVLRPADKPTEILIMDTPDINTAKKIWRWNMNGFGYSSNGINGEFGTAITMEGSIVADFITAGNLNAERITTGTMSLKRLLGDTLTLGGDKNQNGTLEIKDSSGNTLVKLSEAGVTLDNGAKLIGGNGVLSNFQFVGKSTNSQDFCGFYVDYDSQSNKKRRILFDIFIPENFVVTEAKVILFHAPVKWIADVTEHKEMWGFCRNLKVYKVSDLNYERDAYVMSEYVDSNSFSLQDTNSLNFTAKSANSNSHTCETAISQDLKDYITKGELNVFSLETSENAPGFVDDWIYEAVNIRTGEVKAYLNVIGYMS